jgi:CRISPR/Cas system type I-B associated protein Csh2 (Cas7 group RAMP superfamily)
MVPTEYDVEKIKHPLKLLAKNMQSNGHSFKPQVFCRVHWALNAVSKGLMLDQFMSVVMVYL